MSEVVLLYYSKTFNQKYGCALLLDLNCRIFSNIKIGRNVASAISDMDLIYY